MLSLFSFQPNSSLLYFIAKRVICRAAHIWVGTTLAEDVEGEGQRSRQTTLCLYWCWPVAAAQEHCLPPSLWVPGSVLWNMLPSHGARELQQIGLEAKSVPKGSFTTAEGSCFEKDVQDKKIVALWRDTGAFQNLFSFLSFPSSFFPPPLCSFVLSLRVEPRA